MTDWKALGERALTAGFEWRPGMLVSDGEPFPPFRIHGVRSHGLHCEGCISRYAVWTCPDHWLAPGFPELSDPATLGAYVAHLRERVGDETLHEEPCHDYSASYTGLAWYVVSESLDKRGPEATTRAEAWVAFAERWA